MSTCPPSPVNQMFNGRSVFITGASGFIGRVLLEKLLRTYRGINKIYILMRPKKNLTPQERLNKQLLAAPIFDKLKQMDSSSNNKGQSIFDKIHIIEGDIGQANLAISSSDLKLLLEDETLSIVYHSAATVKFDEPLKTSTQFNLIATKSMIDLCKQLKNLKAFCHVSTAYVNSDIKDGSLIEEKIYPMQRSPDEMIKIVQTLDEDFLQQMKPNFLGQRPNTYTFTKALAEHLIAREASELPVAIVRPSIVVAAWKEPLPGWVDNINGPTGIVLAIGKGLMRSMHLRRDVVADIIPVDTCVNTIIAASYYAAKENGKLLLVDEKQQQQQQQQRVECLNKASEQKRVFHCTSGDVNRITWGQMEDLFWPIIRKYPSQQVLRYPFGTFKGNRYHDMLTRLFVHYLPALLIDFLCFILGKKRQLFSIYLRLQSATSALAYFSTTNFNFQTNNRHLLEECLLDPRDKQELQLSIKELNWFHFWDSYVLGARRFVLKEKDETLDASRQSIKRAYYVEMIYRTFWTVICLLILVKFTPIGNMSLNLYPNTITTIQ